jgi:excisionase family DNA binding protein
MAGKFLLLDEAAKTLGITPDELNELRKKQEISAYRDGSSWKFKTADVERLAAKRGSGGDDDLGLGLDDEFDLALADDEPSAVADAGPLTLEDDLGLALDDDLALSSAPSSAPTPKSAAGDDDLSLLDDDLGLALDDSGDISVAKPSAASPAGDALDGGDLDLDLVLADDSAAAGSSEMELASDDTLSSAKSSAPATGGKTGNIDEDEALVLADDAEDELAFDTGDSGVSLLDDDSGSAELQLDDDLDLGDSNALSSDLDVDNLILGDEGGGRRPREMPTEVASAEDFELTPFEEIDSDISDSGSQVIALDSGDEFGEVGSAPAAAEEVSEGGMFGEELEPAGGGMGIGGGGALAAMTPVAAGAAMAEAPYTMGNVVGLSFCALLLLIVGLMMIDLMFNLGTWSGLSPITSSIMDPLVGLIGG